MTSRHFSESAVVFKPDMACDVVPLTPELYQHLDERYDQFHRHALIALGEISHLKQGHGGSYPY